MTDTTIELECCRCGQTKPHTEYTPTPTKPGRGYTYDCKPCRNAYKNAYRRAKRAQQLNGRPDNGLHKNRQAMLPVQTLRDHYRVTIIDHAYRLAATRDHNRKLPTIEAEAELFGVRRETVERWNHGTGAMYLKTAERICDRLEAHPVEIWGDQYLELVAGAA